MENKNKLMWKVLIVLLLLFVVVIFFKQEYDKKQIYEDYSDCIIKKNVCNDVLNWTLVEWKKCIFAAGDLMDMTKEEIELALNNKNPFYLNDSGGKI